MQLANYLEHLGLALPLPPDLATLRRLHLAHLGAFLFHNLEVQRGGVPSLEIDAIERKFYGPDRGGYCFEHNVLFGAALRELGFRVTDLLARVGNPETACLNHLLLRVDLGEGPWIADAGFGGETLLEPMPLAPGASARQCGIDYRLDHDGDHWRLTMSCSGETESAYEFSGAPHRRGDLVMSNWWVATHPASGFRKTITIQRATAEERLILRPKLIRRYAGGTREDVPIEAADFRRRAAELFGIDCGDAHLLYEDFAKEEIAG